MPVVTVLPVTSLKEGRKVYPNEVLLPSGTADLNVPSLVLAHQVRTISKERLAKTRGSIDENTLRDAVDTALRIHLNL